MVLENVDITKLNLNAFRKFECLCELCDCGCFERSKQQHSKTCKRKKQSDIVKPQRNSTACPLSHYRESFKANYNFRPPSAYQPPSDRYVAQVPMDFSTVQKSEFKPIGPVEQVKSFKKIEKYEPPKEPVESYTSYTNDYITRENCEKTQRVKKNSNETTMNIPSDKLSNLTTTREHFKVWSQREQQLKTCTEMPSFAGEMLFPTSERNFSTTTSSVHKGMFNVPRTKPLLRNENSDSIKQGGSFDGDSNYRETFKHHLNAERAQLFDPTKNQANNVVPHQVPMKSISQTKNDYVFHKNGRPSTQAQCDPYQSTLTEHIYPDRTRSLTTVYSNEYKGHDPKSNPVPKSFKKEPPAYEQPAEKIDSETVTRRDFKGIDVLSIPRLKIIKATPSLKSSREPMEFLTMNRKHFPPHEVKPVVLAGDPNPEYYVTPKEKFVGTTTTADTFGPKALEKQRNYKPEFQNIYNSGRMYFNSNYREEFKDHGLTMCEAKAYMIAHKLSQKSDSSKNAFVPRSPQKAVQT